MVPARFFKRLAVSQITRIGREMRRENFPVPNKPKHRLSPLSLFPHQPAIDLNAVGKNEFFGIGRPSQILIKRRLFSQLRFFYRIVLQASGHEAHIRPSSEK
jgi:hypothetical protein